MALPNLGALRLADDDRGAATDEWVQYRAPDPPDPDDPDAEPVDPDHPDHCCPINADRFRDGQWLWKSEDGQGRTLYDPRAYWSWLVGPGRGNDPVSRARVTPTQFRSLAGGPPEGLAADRDRAADRLVLAEPPEVEELVQTLDIEPRVDPMQAWRRASEARIRVLKAELRASIAAGARSVQTRRLRSRLLARRADYGRRSEAGWLGGRRTNPATIVIPEFVVVMLGGLEGYIEAARRRREDAAPASPPGDAWVGGPQVANALRLAGGRGRTFAWFPRWGTPNLGWGEEPFSLWRDLDPPATIVAEVEEDYAGHREDCNRFWRYVTYGGTTRAMLDQTMSNFDGDWRYAPLQITVVAPEGDSYRAVVREPENGNGRTVRAPEIVVALCVPGATKGSYDLAASLRGEAQGGARPPVPAERRAARASDPPMRVLDRAGVHLDAALTQRFIDGLLAPPEAAPPEAADPILAGAREDVARAERQRAARAAAQAAGVGPDLARQMVRAARTARATGWAGAGARAAEAGLGEAPVFSWVGVFRMDGLGYSPNEHADLGDTNNRAFNYVFDAIIHLMSMSDQGMQTLVNANTPHNVRLREDIPLQWDQGGAPVNQHVWARDWNDSWLRAGLLNHVLDRKRVAPEAPEWAVDGLDGAAREAAREAWRTGVSWRTLAVCDGTGVPRRTRLEYAPGTITASAELLMAHEQSFAWQTFEDAWESAEPRSGARRWTPSPLLRS